MACRRWMRKSSNLDSFDDAGDRLEGYGLQQAPSIPPEPGWLEPLPVGHCAAAMKFVAARFWQGAMFVEGANTDVIAWRND